jgi:large subunit ribosomal protein L21
MVTSRNLNLPISSNWLTPKMAALTMLNRTLRRSALDIRIPSSALPPTFLLPSRARYFNSTAQHVESPADDFSSSMPASSSSSSEANSQLPKHTQIKLSKIPSPPPPPSKPLALSDSIKEMLPLLAVQPSHYISTHIHGKPYLVTVGDIVRLPFHMPGVVPGDILRLNRATAIGSRDYTLKGTPYVDERIFECRARVMGTEAEPMRIKEKTKRRNRKVKTVRSKHKYTILRVAELRVRGLDEIENEGSS